MQFVSGCISLIAPPAINMIMLERNICDRGYQTRESTQTQKGSADSIRNLVRVYGK